MATILTNRARSDYSSVNFSNNSASDNSSGKAAWNFRDALDTPSDVALIGAIAKGDKGAMRTLYDRHSAGVFRFIVSLIRDESLAEDLVSEVFIDVWRTAGTFEAKSKVLTWLLAI